VFRNFRKCRDADARSSKPVRAEVPRVLDVTADEYYRAPGEHFARLYAKWIAERAL
jgi:hypothetical protein